MFQQKKEEDYQTVHNLGQLDFYRLDCLLKKADEIGIHVKLPPINPQNILEYYKILDQLYLNIRALVNTEYRNKIDTRFEDIKKELFENEGIKQTKNNITISVGLVDKLRNMHRLLLEVKQIIGLGIPVSKKQSFESRMNRAMEL